ncbi:MAG TPA: 3-isopropylmalate dehydrogenase [Fimbriimonadaceae bacterium]|nr:3-isopropylmalate dehydrogenase [Fimbriimonadaceae bacterium]
MTYKVAVLPGDGIGPEVTAEAVKVLKALSSDFTFEEALVGGAAYDDGGHPLPASTLDLCRKADAVLFGAIGGPKWDKVQPVTLRPEIGALLPLRSELNLYANIRPAKTLSALASASPLKGDQAMIDLIVMRELTGGIYFGQPRERQGDRAIDTCVYSKPEIERIAHQAFRVAEKRNKDVVSVDKANVLETSRLWREVVTDVAKQYPNIKLSHMLVDNCAMQLVRNPRQFDVILTENMFGDILSDEASMITGSLGLLPSASMSDPRGERPFGLYEPIHGSAPDIVGQQKANPLAAILSAAMMLRFTFGDLESAERIEKGVEKALESGLRTADIAEPGSNLVSTSEIGDAVVANLS